MREDERSSSSRIRKMARKMILAAANACGSFSRKKSSLVDPIAFDHSISIPNSNSVSISGSCAVSPKKPKNVYYEEEEEAEDEEEEEDEDEDEDEDVVVVAEEFESTSIRSALPSAKRLCAICLEPLNYKRSSRKCRGSGQAIFTAQCSHAFHLSCISSNVRHGNVTCPVCRAHWTHLPRNLNSSSSSSSDPVLRILDDSIATFRVHRRSLLRSARYDDDDPLDRSAPHHPRLRFSLSPSSSGGRACLSVGLSGHCPTDLVLVASPNGPHLRLLKQCMALVVFSLRPADRLAVVTHSSAAARVFPLRRMTPHGKRAALQAVDRLFYMGRADPAEGLLKGAKILRDRAHRNPDSAVLHLSDSPAPALPGPGPAVHRFHVGFGPGASGGFVMREFGDFLAGLLCRGSAVADVQLRVRAGDSARVVRIGELRGSEERRVLLDLGESNHAFVEYSYSEDYAAGGDDVDNVNDDDERFIIRGESLVSVGDDKSRSDDMDLAAGIAGSGGSGRLSSVESWDYHDPYMARRWAKHLHGYRL